MGSTPIARTIMDKVEELINYLNTAYGFGTEWPRTFEVSAALYGRCCQHIFNILPERQDGIEATLFVMYRVALGREKNGLFFKNVELVIKDDN